MKDECLQMSVKPSHGIDVFKMVYIQELVYIKVNWVM